MLQNSVTDLLNRVFASKWSRSGHVPRTLWFSVTRNCELPYCFVLSAYTLYGITWPRSFSIIIQKEHGQSKSLRVFRMSSWKRGNYIGSVSVGATGLKNIWWKLCWCWAPIELSLRMHFLNRNAIYYVLYVVWSFNGIDSDISLQPVIFYTVVTVGLFFQYLVVAI